MSLHVPVAESPIERRGSTLEFCSAAPVPPGLRLVLQPAAEPGCEAEVTACLLEDCDPTLPHARYRIRCRLVQSAS